MQEDLPAEPTLDRYRDAVASLHLNGTHLGYLATKVEPMRAGLLLRRAERVWLLLTRLDGSRDPVQEDYAPWTYVSELQQGHITWDAPDGQTRYQVQWLEGDERRDAWDRYGILEEIGAYLGGGR
ncbi:hypothetical protein [Kineococcus terrestris]|uniref:hypothetical protein n=1 Tax=Kineococcus terrestris TaxID=2044856 RepID=UPI0034DB0133